MALSFSSIAHAAANASGRPWAFIAAFLTIIIWGVSGPLFGFSDTWQLVINTSTTIITFLMVFLIQNAQNRDTQAIQLKLDELIRVNEGAHNRLIALEQRSEAELALVRQEIAEGCAEVVTPSPSPAASPSG
jgi:low affinity Fe/Cu permease